MAAVASSSKLAGSTRQRPPKDAFKPKFPLDPFAGASATALGEPWFLKIDALLSATALQRRNVIFVLGAPSLQELGPLLQSRGLAKSLVILATHKPPDIPGIVIPCVRVLRLSAPLALEDTGAVRFVNVLEWAERVARFWRKDGGGGVLELSENADGNNELTPPSTFRFGSHSTPTSPGSSSTQLSTESSSSSRPSSMAFFTRRGHGSLPPPDPSQRPIDVLINFMPEKVSDKALLKNSILVTTISRPFLTSSVHPAPPTIRSRTASSASARLRPQSIFSAFSRSSTSVYMPPTPPYQSGESLSLAQVMPAPPGKALLIHLLPVPLPNAPPAARRKLVESMESFLLSFAFQSPPTQQASGLGVSEPLERARPYVTQSTTFCEPVGSELGAAEYGDWTVADVILSGALDADTPNVSTTVGAPPAMTTSASMGAVPKPSSKASRRAWIAVAADIVIMPSSTDDPNVPAPVESTHISSRRADSALSTVSQSVAMGKRSSSAPLLSSDWHWTSRPFSHPASAQAVSAMARNGKGVYSPTSPTVAPSGLPTPPHSEEEAGSGVDSIGLDAGPPPTASTLSVAAPVGRHVGGHGSGYGQGESRSQKKPKWKFWLRGHRTSSSLVKA